MKHFFRSLSWHLPPKIVRSFDINHEIDMKSYLLHTSLPKTNVVFISLYIKTGDKLRCKHKTVCL